MSSAHLKYVRSAVGCPPILDKLTLKYTISWTVKEILYFSLKKKAHTCLDQKSITRARINSKVLDQINSGLICELTKVPLCSIGCW